jgi:hypothetical protein
MRELKLNKNKIALVDDEDFEFLNMFNWKIRIENGAETVYCSMKLHKFLAKTYQFDTKDVIDHKDGNRLNNQKNNLRPASRKENSRNMKVRKNTTGFKGVYPNLNKNRFVVKIFVNNKQMHLGVFDTAEEAAKVYDENARKYFGEFAKTNFD